jgi:hypothetical protein
MPEHRHSLRRVHKTAQFAPFHLFLPTHCLKPTPREKDKKKVKEDVRRERLTGGSTDNTGAMRDEIEKELRSAEELVV